MVNQEEGSQMGVNEMSDWTREEIKVIMEGDERFS